MNILPSRWPGVVDSYDAAKRQCRVKIPGITDGASEYPIAEIEQAVGDKSAHTEIEILAGDMVWLAFENGDPRFPIITGFRARNTGNAIDWRRWHHANVEITFDHLLQLVNGAATLKLDADAGAASIETSQAISAKAGDGAVVDAGTSVTIKAGSVIKIEAGGSTIELSSGGVTIKGATINLN